MRTAASEVDAALSVAEVASIEDQIAPLTAEERALARLAIVFGITALALAAIGLYGVLSYGISRRSAEIAIRIALGAKASWVVRMILRESLRLVVFGVVAGGVLAVYAPRIIATRLYGVAPDDPLTFVVAILALLLVAMGSIYGPARRASRVDPMIALHQG